jgi:protein dithiol:quinone oxidoreductase
MSSQFRRINFILFIITAIILGFSYYVEFGLGYSPCLLCVIQRFIFFVLAFIFLLASLHKHNRASQIIYCFFSLIVLVLGILAASRQIWIQHLPMSTATSCLPSAMYLFKNFPIKEIISITYSGTAECSIVHWRFLGITMAEWALLWYVVFLIVVLWQWFKKK